MSAGGSLFLAYQGGRHESCREYGAVALWGV